MNIVLSAYWLPVHFLQRSSAYFKSILKCMNSNVQTGNSFSKSPQLSLLLVAFTQMSCCLTSVMGFSLDALTNANNVLYIGKEWVMSLAKWPVHEVNEVDRKGSGISLCDMGAEGIKIGLWGLERIDLSCLRFVSCCCVEELLGLICSYLKLWNWCKLRPEWKQNESSSKGEKWICIWPSSATTRCVSTQRMQKH